MQFRWGGRDWVPRMGNITWVTSEFENSEEEQYHSTHHPFRFMGRFPSCISLTFNLIPFYHCPRVPLSIKEDTDPVTWLCPFPALLAYCRRPSSFQRKDEPWQAWCCGMGWGDGRSLDYKDTERRGCVPGASSQTVSQTPHLAQGKAPRANAMDTSTMLWMPG